MNIAQALHPVSRLYIETAPIIYFTESTVGYVNIMRAIFGHVIQQQIQLVTATITLTETLMKPLQANDTAFIAQYRTLFYSTQGMTLVPVRSVEAESAADLRARYNLLTPDALHVASAISSKCDALLTNDKGLKRVNELSILVLDDLTV